MVNVLFFAQLRELLGASQHQVDVQAGDTIAQIRQRLQQAFPDWADMLAAGKAIAALNQELVDDATAVNDGDEVAFFPPVTGG